MCKGEHALIFLQRNVSHCSSLNVGPGSAAFLNESLTKQLQFPHAPALTHAYLYTHVPAPSWTEQPACSPRTLAALGFALARRYLPGKPPYPREGGFMSCPVNQKGCNLFITLSPHPQARLMCFSGSPDSCGLHYLWWGPRLAPNTEPNTQRWITAWYAAGCQIFDNLFLMKIPPVIPRISCSAKKWALCVFCCGLNFFPALHSSVREQRRKGGGSSWLLFFVVIFSTWLLWNMWRSIACN